MEDKTHDPILKTNLPNPAERRFQRKQVLVPHSFQIAYALLTMALVSLACFMVWWETYRSLSHYSSMGIFVDPVVMALFHRISVAVFIKIISMLFLVGVFSVLISHYIAGPLHRIEMALERLGKMDLSFRVRLRKRDGLKRLEAAFNKTSNALQEAVRGERLKIERVIDRLDYLAKNKTRMSEEMNDIKQELRDVLGQFHVDE